MPDAHYDRPNIEKMHSKFDICMEI